MLALPLVLALFACGGAETAAPQAPETARPDGGPTATANPAGAACKGKSWIVVRHAEKATDDPKDPSLSEKGKGRANVLAAMVASMKPTRLVASQFKRTQETLAPLAAKTGLQVEVRDAGKSADLVTELKAAPDGSVVVVATHSNVLPALVRGVGGTLKGVEGDSIPETEFHRVVMVTQPCGDKPASTMEMSSGE